MALQPAIRQPIINPATGAVESPKPVAGSITGGASVGNSGPTIQVGGGRLPAGVAGVGGLQPATRTGIVTGPGGEYVSGDPAEYARLFAGVYPTQGTYEDPQSLAEKSTAQNNYGAGIANLDQQQNRVGTSFQELLGLLSRSKTKNLGSLADSMADRGLSNSGIFLNSTGDVNQNYADQISSNTAQRDEQFNSINQNRTNYANQLAQALALADQEAMNRRIAAWNSAYDAAYKQANDALAARQKAIM